MPAAHRDPLLTIPALADAGSNWHAAGRAALQALVPSPELIASVAPLTCPRDEPRSHAFVSAAYLADRASYPEPADQVAFPWLSHVVRVFPRGFRLWGADVPGAGWRPVGYTGWYPIAESDFEVLERRASSLRDRQVVPLPEIEPGGSFVYVFNFSVVSALRGTAASKRLVRALADDLAAARPRGLAAITVSADGARVVERFGMKRTGTMVVGGCEEHVYTGRVAREGG